MRKIAISGKGGVGKSTLAACMAYVYSERGSRVFAVDADPDGNLAAALGIPEDLARRIVPLSRMDELIYERTGAKPGAPGTFFRLNPRVDDLPEQLSVKYKGVELLVMGTVSAGGSGCVCPESAMLRALVTHMTLHRDEVVILDMEAGIEHLGRATASGVDAFIVVVEPGLRSIQTARTVSTLADDIGVKRICVVGNKIRQSSDRDFLAKHLDGFEILGFIPSLDAVIEADLRGLSPYHSVPELAETVKPIVATLEA